MDDDTRRKRNAEAVRRQRTKASVRERDAKQRNAYAAAQRLLRESHPEEFARYYAQARSERGLT